MLSAYDRERELMPLLVSATQRGVRCDREALMRDIVTYEGLFEAVEGRIRRSLGAPGLNIGSGAELAVALDNASAVTEKRFTPTGRRSTARGTLMETILDEDLRNDLVYRQILETCVGTFMRPWLVKSEADGRLHPNWNQVRTRGDKGDSGTRTGRLSSSDPNFQNIPNDFEGVKIPKWVDVSVSPIPTCRRYILPEVGHKWLKRDFSSQEIRIAAHFEDGLLLQAYIKNPDLDPHQMAKEIIQVLTGMDFLRKHVKITGFQIIYGGGIPSISSQVGCDTATAAQLRYSYFQAMPGIEELANDTRRRGRLGRPIITWGGRRYYTEPPQAGRSFEYKLLNYLIQGSAADQTKQCIIDWHKGKRTLDIFLATVHDEINVSTPEQEWEEGMERLRKSMDQPLFDCPMRSEGYVGDNWADLTKIENEYGS